MIILGIDPGLANTGWGVVDFKNSRYWPVSFGSIVTKPDRTLQERLTIIATHLKEIAIKYKISISIGIVKITEENLNYHKLLNLGDNTMYKSKAKGTGKFTLYEE